MSGPCICPRGPVFAVSTSRLPGDVKETLQVERQGPWRAALPTCVSRVHAHGGADRGARQCEAAAKRAQRAISRVVRHACVLARGIDKNKVSLCSLNWRWPVQSQISLAGFPAGVCNARSRSSSSGHQGPPCPACPVHSRGSPGLQGCPTGRFLGIWGSRPEG